MTCCQEYGHAAAVCRGTSKCGRCGKAECIGKKCEEEQKPAECLHCKGNHRAGAASCPKRIKEVNVNKMRKGKRMLYAEALKTLDRNETVHHEPEEKTKETWEPSICYDKKTISSLYSNGHKLCRRNSTEI